MPVHQDRVGGDLGEGWYLLHVLPSPACATGSAPRSVWECVEHVVAQRVTFSWALMCVNGFRALWVRPDMLRLNAFGRGGTGVARYRKRVEGDRPAIPRTINMPSGE